jgi:hypothetical protein
MIWVDRRVPPCALVVLAWLFSIELGTSRKGSRDAAKFSDLDEQVIDKPMVRSRCRNSARRRDRCIADLPTGRHPAPADRRHHGPRLVGRLRCIRHRCTPASGRFHRDSLTVHGDHELVDTGPYRRVRHPLYTATIGVFVGVGAVLGHWLSLAFALLPLGALLHRIRVEEPMLDEALGTEYTAYRRRTSRLVPGVW